MFARSWKEFVYITFSRYVSLYDPNRRGVRLHRLSFLWEFVEDEWYNVWTRPKDKNYRATYRMIISKYRNLFKRVAEQRWTVIDNRARICEKLNSHLKTKTLKTSSNTNKTHLFDNLLCLCEEAVKQLQMNVI